MNGGASIEPPLAVRVTHRFHAPAERVFDAWLGAETVRKWMTVSGAMKRLVRVQIEARVGGSFSFVDVRAGAELDHTGVYLEMMRPDHLAFTWGVREDPAERPDSSRVIIDIAPLPENSCELTLVHELHPDWSNYAGRTEASWRKMLDGIDAALG